MMLVLVLAAGLAGTAPVPPVTASPAAGAVAAEVPVPPPEMSPDLADFVADAKEWVLHGRRLPSEYRVRLARMTPADRIQALIFLRRAGLLTGETWGVQELLAEQTDQKGDH